jgi:hypothetical protein
MIVGITGHKQAGKSTVGAFLTEHFGFKVMGFADPLKQMLLALDPIIPTDGECILGYYPRIWDLVELHGMDTAKELYPEIRRLLQRLGTEAGREVLGESVWVKALFSRIDPAADIAITDVRFTNEADAVWRDGGLVIKVSRPGYDGDDHASERDIDYIAADYHIPNDGTLGDLEWRVKEWSVLSCEGKP